MTSTQPGMVVAGVVADRAELDVQEEYRPGETGRRLVPRDGAAQSGEYLSIVYSRTLQVKAAGAIGPHDLRRGASDLA